LLCHFTEPTLNIRIFSVVLLLTVAGCAHRLPVYQPVATDNFNPLLAFWHSHHPGQSTPTYRRNQIIAIADNLLLMQRNNGGWPANINPFRVLSAADRLAFLKDKTRTDASFANANITPQIYYLSHVYLQTGDVRYRDGAKKAFRLVLGAQLYNGGWSQKAVTELDNSATIDTRATINALAFMRRVAAGKMPYGYVPFAVRRQAAESVRKGDSLLLRLQQAYDSRASIWAGAYDLASSQPTAAQHGAVVALDTEVSVAITRYFMQIERPPAEVVRAITGAAHWFADNTLQQVQLRTARQPAPWLPAYTRAPLPRQAVWARHYAIATNQPLVGNSCGRPLKPYELTVLAGAKHWYGYWARALLQSQYPKWRTRVITPPGGASL
jgi:PelA/Pel-15E family pectate lyase